MFLCLLLALCSCNQNSKQEKSAVKNIDTITTGIENIQKREPFKQVADNLPNELAIGSVKISRLELR